jgi:hypothetical protein
MEFVLFACSLANYCHGFQLRTCESMDEYAIPGTAREVHREELVRI